MKKPWMPLYIADYIADTPHLSAAQHGAYLLLIMHYWRQGGLPKTDAELARIARMDRYEWARSRKIIAAFFGENWHHARIENELSHAHKVSQVRQEMGARGGLSKSLKSKEPALANATDLPPTLPPPLPDVCSSKPPSKPPSKNVDTSHTIPNGIVHSIPLPNGKGVDLPILEVPVIETPEFKLYRRGKEILGKNSGGMIKNLLAATNGSIPQARAALETASEKENCREYIGAVIRGRTRNSSGAADDRIS